MLEQLNNEKVIEESAKFWYIRSNISLSKEEVKESHRNLAGFFQVLSEWDQRNRARQSE